MNHARTLLAAALISLPVAVATPATPAAAADWTVFVPSGDSRVVYVSSSQGNDTNSGLSQAAPKRTIAAGYALLRDGYPDWLLLRSGDTWYEGLGGWDKSGRSAAEMMRIGSYGAGERPRLLTGTSSGFEGYSPSFPVRGNLAITDVHLRADGYDGSNGSPFGISLVGPWTNVLIENCRVEAYFTNLPLQGTPEARMSNIRVRRNVVADAYKVGPESHPQGLLIGHCTGGLIEENVFDHNGWREDVPGATPTIFRHNVYLNPENTTGLVVRGNIVGRGGASGLRSSGEVCENNLLLANPVNLVVAQDVRVIRNNVILDSRDMTPTDPRGFGASIRGALNLEVYGNIFAHRTSAGYYNISAIDIGSTTHNVTIRNNVVYNWNPPGENVGQAVVFSDAPSGILVANNLFQQPAGGRLVWDNSGSAGYALSGNTYYSLNGYPFHRSVDQNYPQWVAATGEVGSAYAPLSIPDPNRSIATYMQSLGLPASLDAFMNEARRQARGSWRPQFTAAAVGNYVRAGFGMPPVGGGNCPADFTGDGVITVTDAILFVNAFVAADLRADMDGNGLLNINDYVRFQSAIAAGCP